jgi:thiol-disulfide isomerase/thioredoxin
MIEPVFERLADEKGIREDKNGAGFAKVDLGVGMGHQVAGQYGVRATPTFIFFLDGKKARLSLSVMTESQELTVSAGGRNSRC